MAKLQIVYDATDEIETIIKSVEKHVDMQVQEKELREIIHKMFQDCFTSGMKFQRQLSLPSPVKDSISIKMEL